MKKALTALALAALLPLASFAADRGSDGVMMQNGMMLVMNHGSTMTMPRDMTLTDGSRVLRNGTVLRADGTTLVLHNGDAMALDGNFMVRDGVQLQR